MNISTPVGCIARLIPFHDAIIVYFCRAVSGKRGSGADGGGGSFGVTFTLSDFVLAANFPSSQPIFILNCAFSNERINLLFFFCLTNVSQHHTIENTIFGVSSQVYDRLFSMLLTERLSM